MGLIFKADIKIKCPGNKLASHFNIKVTLREKTTEPLMFFFVVVFLNVF